jgi:hypothetical protein
VTPFFSHCWNAFSVLKPKDGFEFFHVKKVSQTNLLLPLNAGFDHVAGHEFQSLFQMAGKFGIRPM